MDLVVPSEMDQMSVMEILSMPDEKAKTLFAHLRWPETDGNPVCPRCGCLSCYDIRRANVFRCKECRRDFTMTNGSIFDSHKMSLKFYLAALAIYKRDRPWNLATVLARKLDIQYRAAWYLSKRLSQVEQDR